MQMPLGKRYDEAVDAVVRREICDVDMLRGERPEGFALPLRP